MDSIELAEAAVERDKAAVVAAFGLVSRKAEGALGSPLVLGGALLGAVLVGYLAAGRTGNKRRATGTWSLALQIARFLIPLVRRSAPPRGGMAPPSASSVPDRGGDPGPRKMNLRRRGGKTRKCYTRASPSTPRARTYLAPSGGG